MKCKNCGEKLTRGQQTCPACGAPAPKSRRGLWGTVFVIVLVLICSAVLIVMNLRGRSELPDLSWNSLRALFAREKTESVEAVPEAEDALRELPAEEIPEEAGEEIVGESVEEAAEEAVAETAGEAVEEIAVEETAEDALEENAEETVEVLAEEAAAPLADTTVLDAAPVLEEAAPAAPQTALERYREAESRGFEALGAAFASALDQRLQAVAEPLDHHAAFLCRLELGESGRALAAKLFSMDMKWLSSLSFSGESDLLDSRAGETLSLALNDAHVLGLEMLLEAASGEIALRVPELSESWLAAEAETEELDFETLLAQYKAVLAALPRGEQLQAMLNRYAALLLQCVENVEEGSGTLEAEGVVQRCTTYTLDIDQETAARVAAALVGELRWDDELEALIRSLAEAAGQDAESAYAAFLTGLDELDYELAQAEESGETLRMVLYVDGEGVIRGRTLRLLSDGDSFLLSYACPRDGERFGLELRALSDGELVEFAGRGNLANEAVSGSFILREDSERVARVDIERLEQQQLALKLTPGQRFYDELAASLHEELLPWARELSLRLRMSGTEEQVTMNAEVSRAADVLFTLDLSEQLSRGASVGEAADVLGQDAWFASLSKESADPIFENLRQTGLPAALQLSLRASWNSMFE